MLIYRDFTFDSAHILPGYSIEHPMEKLMVILLELEFG